jgi:hypothetical protein
MSKNIFPIDFLRDLLLQYNKLKKELKEPGSKTHGSPFKKENPKIAYDNQCNPKKYNFIRMRL